MTAGGISYPQNYENPERRSLERTRIAREALIFIPGLDGVRPCCVRDVTNLGAGIRAHDVALLPLNFIMSFDRFRTGRDCRLIWRQGDFFGVAFAEGLQRGKQ